MIIESDDVVLILDEQEDLIIKAIPSSFTDEWLIITEDEYGESTIRSITKIELESEFGKIKID